MNASQKISAAGADVDADRWLPAIAKPSATTTGLSLINQGIVIFGRRKWLIVGCVAISVVAGILLTLLATPQYTAQAVIEIQRESRSFAAVQKSDGNDGGQWLDNEFYQTQYGLLQSRSLAYRVVTQLRLENDQSFFERFSVRKAADWFANGRLKPDAAPREERVRVAAETLLKHLSVNPERLSRLVTVSFTSPDAAFSQKVVSAWSAQFIQQTLSRRFDTTSYARHFLEGRLADLRVRIDQSERQLVDYASREGIINLPSSGGSKNDPAPDHPLVADDLAALNQELAQATADRVRTQARLDNSQANQISEALQSPGIAQLRNQRTTLAGEYARMMVQFEPDYPPAVALRRQLQQVDTAIRTEESRFSGSLRDAYNANVARENVLRTRVKSLEREMLNFRRRSIQYNIYQRDVDTNRQLYDALLQRYKEIGVAGGVGVNNISIVDNAELPAKPSSPRPFFNLLLALLGGFAVGAIAAIIAEQIDDRLHNPADVQNMLDLALLGTTPKVPSTDINTALHDIKSPLSEAYLSLQTNLSFSTPHGVPKVISITSGRPAEGKSTTSYALARALARTGCRVLLMDGDMRSPSVHQFFGMRNTEGLSNCLSGHEVERMWVPAGIENLWVMTAGPQPPSAAELLMGEGLTTLLRTLRAEFDHIIVDSPPVMGLADAPLIGTAVDATVFVLDAQSTRRTIAQVAIRRLLTAHNHVLGAVLTKYDAQRSSYGYDYQYSYGDKTESAA